MAVMKTSIVFGGTSGIGRATAELFLRSGYNVAVLSRAQEKVSGTEEHLKSIWKAKRCDGDAPIMGMVCDVRDEENVKKAVTNVENRLGPIDVLVNAAGINENSLHIKTSRATMDKLMSVNLIGPMLTCKTVLRSMLSRRTGSIINIGSVVGTNGNPGQATYSATKAGLIGLTKSLAKEVAPKGIRVNIVVPGYIDTEMTASVRDKSIVEAATPMKRLGQPIDVAEAVKMLTESNYITGTVLYVDGGLHLNF